MNPIFAALELKEADEVVSQFELLSLLSLFSFISSYISFTLDAVAFVTFMQFWALSFKFY